VNFFCEDISVSDIAKEVGTPFYLYSKATLTRHFKAFDSSFEDVDHLTCFAVKSCSNIAVLSLFGNLGGALILSLVANCFGHFRLEWMQKPLRRS